MATIGAAPCFLLFIVSVHIGVVQLTGNCCCYYCNGPNQSGSCLNATVCNLRDKNKTVATECSNDSLATTLSCPNCFYSCDANCSTVHTSDCGRSSTRSSQAETETSVGTRVAIICVSAGAPVVGLVVLGLIGMLAFHHLKRMGKRKKESTKILPVPEVMDVSIRTLPVTHQMAISGALSNADGVTNCEPHVATTSRSPNSSSSCSPTHKPYKEDWIIPMGSPSAVTSSLPPSRLAIDKASSIAVNQTQPTYTNEGPTSENTDHYYINTKGLVNEEDEQEDSSPNSPDYVNTQGRSSADDDDLDYENVDDSVVSARAPPTLVPKILMQKHSPVAPQSNGLAHTSPEKAVSSNWLASIAKDKAAPMDPDYVDMTGNLKLKLKSMLSLKRKNKETVPASISASAPEVRKKDKNQPVVPIYVNQPAVPPVPRKPKTRTIQDLLLTTNL